MPGAEGAAGKLAVTAIERVRAVSHRWLRRIADHQAVQAVAAMAGKTAGVGRMGLAGVALVSLEHLVVMLVRGGLVHHLRACVCHGNVVITDVHGRPAHLNGQQHDQEDETEALHGPDDNKGDF